MPSEDPDDRRIRELAIAINREAGSVGDGRAIAEFYALSLTGALVIVAAPLAGAAINEYLLGSAEERILYESYKLTQARIEQYIADYSGRIISETRLGAWLVRVVGYGDGFVQKLAWNLASRMWAWGAGSTVTVVLSDTPNDLSYLFTVEIPRLCENPNVFLPLRYFLGR